MDLDHLAVISPTALISLERLIKNAECSPRSVQVAALLAPDYPAAEKLLFDLLFNCSSEEDSNLPSLALCVNALALMAIDRGDAQLASRIFEALAAHDRLIPLLCSDLMEQFPRLGQRAALGQLMDGALAKLSDPNQINEIEWQLSTLALDGKGAVKIPKLLEQLHKTDSKFLKGLLVTSAGQFPLPGFNIAQWNSQEPVEIPTSVSVQSGEKVLNQNILANCGSSILMVNKDHVNLITSRTIVGRHCWQVKDEEEEQFESTNVNDWLRKVSQRRAPLEHSDSRSSGILGVMSDPFQDLASFAPPQKQSVDCSSMQSFLEKCSRKPFTGQAPPIEKMRSKSEAAMTSTAAATIAALDVDSESYTDSRSLAWRQFASNFQLIQSASNVPSNFIRELRHLDTTLTREPHKVAVIYVAPGQEDKVSILGNNEGSDSFNRFVEGLGWTITTGPNHAGYSGGLPAGLQTPYYATGNCEVVFHVSTRLGGDMTHKLKHIGNDEVHVVWSEHNRYYRRETIATSFCDILIVLQKISPTLVRVHIDKKHNMEFGPLFDGAHVHVRQLPHLIRDTVINASRIYRIHNRPDTQRPNRYREKAFSDTTRKLSAMSPSATISHLYVPFLKS
ncbi:hypothetical protein L596_007789 [Steinernema carpocapsae]|uniref:Rap-GAP domain-containing protein n=1 Tax=Steinernema carpocapsae TaxID=34508 RepID=A0A4U5PAL9_STECR|nr:hypothetical protein L596_007789 [Steinernema carpocapsae]